MPTHIRFENVTVTYGPKTALADVSLDIPERQILAVIGPANSGKTTLLRCINRTLDFIPSAKVEGHVSIALRSAGVPPAGEKGGEKGISPIIAGHPESVSDRSAGVPPAGDNSGRDARAPEMAFDGQDVFKIRNVYELRRRVGMVFPLPVGLPLSVYENVAYAPRRAGIHDRHELDETVERSLRQAMLWDEVKDRMNMLGTKLSGGQQQRLTLARALSLRPEILCLDEFSIAIDPVTTMRIEDILRELKNEMTIVLVTNLVQQARRLADRTAFFSDSHLIEADETEVIFNHAKNRLTERYVTGDFG
jgi:phosphate transport system ATP-binding protein